MPRVSLHEEIARFIHLPTGPHLFALIVLVVHMLLMAVLEEKGASKNNEEQPKIALAKSIAKEQNA